jgi:hypothetical protein
MASSMLLATINAANSAQNCQNLPKDGTLKHHQKLRFYCFQILKNLRVEDALEHVSTIWIFNPRIFIWYFYCQKMAFVCEFQHTPLWKLMFYSRFHTSCGHEILWTYTYSPRNKNPKRLISYLLQKVAFMDPKRLLSPLSRGEKTFFLQL